MAKQSGIHQLRGKVGEHSYYRQTGIQSGLVRSINQGMSARVKTDDAFSNTRLNNAEFGQAGRLASVLARYISPKFRPMVLPFSQSKMAKIILDYIKNDTTAPWGQRNIVEGNSGDMQVVALNSVVKNRFGDFGLSLVVNEEVGRLEVNTSVETANKLTAIGADGITLRLVVTTTAIGKYNTIRRAYYPSGPSANVYEDEVDATGSTSFTYVVPPAPALPNIAFGAQRTGILIALPFRNVNGSAHILQEHCTYKAFILVDGAVE